MEDIRIYDFDFNLVHIEPSIKSVYWTFYYNDIGTFEGTFPIKNELLDVLLKYEFLFLTQGKKQAIITGKKIENEIRLYGRTPNWILTRRTVSPFNTKNFLDYSYEDVVMRAIEDGFSDVADELITFENSAGEKGKSHLVKCKRETVFDVIRERLEKDALGHSLTLNIKTKKWDFKIYDGKIREEILSEQNRNLKNTVLTENALEFCNSGWYKLELTHLGEIDPSYQVPQNDTKKYGSYYTVHYEDPDDESEEFPEGCYFVCSNMKTGAWEFFPSLPELCKGFVGDHEGMRRWETVFDVYNKDEANEELKKIKKEESITGETMKMRFETDFSLGDIFRLQINKGGHKMSVKRQILGVEMWAESGNSGEKIIFSEDRIEA